jgi:hypothetical protein
LACRRARCAIAIAKQHRHDPALKQARKRFYCEMLACHARHQHLVRLFRL